MCVAHIHRHSLLVHRLERFVVALFASCFLAFSRPSFPFPLTSPQKTTRISSLTTHLTHLHIPDVWLATKLAFNESSFGSFQVVSCCQLPYLLKYSSLHYLFKHEHSFNSPSLPKTLFCFFIHPANMMPLFSTDCPLIILHYIYLPPWMVVNRYETLGLDQPPFPYSLRVS